MAFSVAGLTEAGPVTVSQYYKKASSVAGLSEAGRAEGSQDRGH